MVITNIIAYILVIIGALNWGLYGLFDFNLVGTIFMEPRAIGAIITYSLIALAALWLIISPMITHGVLKLHGDREIRETQNR